MEGKLYHFQESKGRCLRIQILIISRKKLMLSINNCWRRTSKEGRFSRNKSKRMRVATSMRMLMEIYLQFRLQAMMVLSRFIIKMEIVSAQFTGKNRIGMFAWKQWKCSNIIRRLRLEMQPLLLFQLQIARHFRSSQTKK